MSIAVESLASLRTDHQDATIVLAHGVFDLLHPGHLRHLEVAKSLGDILVVGLWEDGCVSFKKGASRPINALETRMAAVKSLDPVDEVFGVPGVGWPSELMRPVLGELQPDYYLVSSRNNPLFGGVGRIEHDGGRLTTMQYDLSYAEKVHSTTDIIDRLAAAAPNQSALQGVQ